MPRPPKRGLRLGFGRAVRNFRLRSGLTQEQLSFRAGVHRTYIGDLERGLKSPTLDVIAALASALDVHPASLVEAAARPPSRVGRDH